MNTRRTPKVFQSNFRPPTISKPSYRSLRPLLWLAVAMLVVFAVSRISIFPIKTIDITGQASEGVRNELEKLKGKGLLSREVKHRLGIIAQTTGELSALECSKGLPSTLKCSATARTPALAWKLGESYFEIDQRGQVYSKVSETQVRPVVIDRTPSSEPAMGTNILSTDLIAIYRDIPELLTKSGYTVDNLFVADSLYQIGAQVTGRKTESLDWLPGKPINFLFSTSYPISDQVQVINQLVDGKRDRITQSVDVRVPGYAYTK